jgi:hypothetical protein
MVFLARHDKNGKRCVFFVDFLTFVKLRHMDRNRKHFLCKSRDGQSLCTFPFFRALPTATRYPPHSIHVLRCFFTMPSGLITLLTLSSDPIALGGCFCVVISIYVPKAFYESDCALDGHEWSRLWPPGRFCSSSRG